MIYEKLCTEKKGSGTVPLKKCPRFYMSKSGIGTCPHWGKINSTEMVQLGHRLMVPETGPFGAYISPLLQPMDPILHIYSMQ